MGNKYNNILSTLFHIFYSYQRGSLVRFKNSEISGGGPSSQSSPSLDISASNFLYIAFRIISSSSIIAFCISNDNLLTLALVVSKSSLPVVIVSYKTLLSRAAFYLVVTFFSLLPVHYCSVHERYNLVIFFEAVTFNITIKTTEKEISALFNLAISEVGILCLINEDLCIFFLDSLASPTLIWIYIYC